MLRFSSFSSSPSSPSPALPLLLLLALPALYLSSAIYADSSLSDLTLEPSEPRFAEPDRCDQDQEGCDEMLLKVSLLQGGMNVRRTTLGTSHGAPTSATAKVQTAISQPLPNRLPGKIGSGDEDSSLLQSQIVLKSHQGDKSAPLNHTQKREPGILLRQAELGLDCQLSLNTVWLQALLESLRSFDAYPSRPYCSAEELEKSRKSWWLPGLFAKAHEYVQVATLGASATEAISSSTSSAASQQRTLLLGYLFFYLFCLASVWYWLNNPSRVGDRKIQYSGSRRVKTQIDVEEATWRQSWFGWLTCSWATNWVAKWGSSVDSHLSKVHADQLPQMGTRDVQADACAHLFERYWREEVEARGLEQASLLRVILRMWTKRTMFWMMFVLLVQQMITNLYTVIVIEQAMNYFVWLQQQRRQNPNSSVSLTAPILCVIAVFLTVPFINCILSSVAHNIGRRLDQKVGGALCVAVFQKGQRLPTSYLHSRAVTANANASNSGVVDVDDPVTATTTATSSDPSLPSSPSANSNSEEADAVDMLQIIGYDILANLQGAYFQVCMLGTCLAACTIFSVMLWMRLGKATLVALGVAVCILVILTVACGWMGECFGQVSAVADKRVQVTKEMLQGVRVVKCYAWEDWMEIHIGKLRNQELSWLERYYAALGFVSGVALMFPRVLVISALAACSSMYGIQGVSSILVSMQILYFLKASCEGLGIALGRAVTIQPSIRRIESFLKTPEAPFLYPDRVPAWVSLWDAGDPGGAGGAEAGKENNGEIPKITAQPSATPIHLKGNFRWTPDGKNVLHDINLEIKRGELVGIVGSVGSGKSTLLQALLGELYPDPEDCSVLLQRPTTIAYCPQVAHIAEGTLKTNVLFGAEYDHERYHEALDAASLSGDLKVLPGGDCVPVGARGISLSGGQKARVSMARAAYNQTSQVVLMDDPFSSVDPPTAMALNRRLLMGPLLVEKTRIVVLQPDVDRLKNYDKVILVEDGRIQASGPPEEVISTEAFQQLLCSGDRDDANTDAGSGDVSPAKHRHNLRREDSRVQADALRDEEAETRPTSEMVQHYCSIGHWRDLICCAVFFCVQMVMWLFADLVLANWTNAIAENPEAVNPNKYIGAYLFWLLFGGALFPISWVPGMRFTLRISHDILGSMLSKVLNAPIDRFFDKHPIGRIMNRMIADLGAVDFNLFSKATNTIAILYYTLLPLLYVHFVLPWYVSLLAVPLYYVVSVLCRRYWNTTVPMKYCAANARNEINGIVGDVVNNNAVIRAYGDQERVFFDMCDAVDNQLKSVLYSERVLRRWLLIRVRCLWSFFTTSMYLVGLMSTDRMEAGTLGLCLSMLLVVEALIEPNLESATGAQAEFISLARIHEYQSIPQEAPRWVPSDCKYRNFVCRIDRSDLGRLVAKTGSNGRAEVHRVKENGEMELILVATEDGRAMEGAPPMNFASKEPFGLALLSLSESKMSDCTDWHRLIATNDANDAESIAKELAEGTSETVALEVRSKWLSKGAKVEVKDLRVGYGDTIRDVLKGVSVTFEPRTKVGICGTTGCGKSSLLWAILRVLEPRTGCILLDGVDTTKIGLGTLRRAMGLVPQDPVLFTGTLRSNLDPLGFFSEERLRKALDLVQLSDVIASWPEGMEKVISDEGGSLSFGQRQLICIARMVLREPRLLLLDEATSAIDPKTQAEVQRTIHEAFKDSTVVAVAHRLETILDFDHVCVLDRGLVVEQGPVLEVSQKSGGVLNRMLAASRR